MPLSARERDDSLLGWAPLPLVTFPRHGRRHGSLTRGQDLRFSFKTREKRGQRYAEGRSNFGDVLEAEVALAALDRSHERPVNPAFVGKAFLRIPRFGSQLPNALPQGP
jgi:hypothetical protein